MQHKKKNAKTRGRNIWNKNAENMGSHNTITQNFCGKEDSINFCGDRINLPAMQTK